MFPVPVKRSIYFLHSRCELQCNNNCKGQCDCETCNPFTGDCDVIPETTTSDDASTEIYSSFKTERDVERSSYFTLKNPYTVPKSTPYLTKYYTFFTTTEKTALTEIASATSTTDAPKKYIHFFNKTNAKESNNQYEGTENTNLTATTQMIQHITIETPVPTAPFLDINTQPETDTASTETDRPVEIAKANNNGTDAKVETDDVTSTTTLLLQEGVWLNDQADSDVINQINKSRPDYVVLIGYVAVVAIVTIITIAALVFVIKRKRKSQMSKVEKNIDKTTVSVYTKSIFHTPLPGIKNIY